MTQQRGWFGIIYFQSFVYVFGGFYSGWNFTKKCERFDLNTNTWCALPEMNRVRSSFNACRWKLKVYVAGGWDNPESEVFDLPTQTFQKLPFVINQSSRTLCWAKDDTLIIVQNCDVYKWKFCENSNSPGEAVRNPAFVTYVWTNTPPVEKAGKLYYLLWDNGCGYSFDLKTNQVTQVVKCLFSSIY